MLLRITKKKVFTSTEKKYEGLKKNQPTMLSRLRLYNRQHLSTISRDVVIQGDVQINDDMLTLLNSTGDSLVLSNAGSGDGYLSVSSSHMYFRQGSAAALSYSADDVTVWKDLKLDASHQLVLKGDLGHDTLLSTSGNGNDFVLNVEDAGDSILFQQGGVTRFAIDADGHAIVGGMALELGNGGATQPFQIRRNQEVRVEMKEKETVLYEDVVLQNRDDADAPPPRLHFYRFQGDVVNGQTMGDIMFEVFDNVASGHQVTTDKREMALIRCAATQTIPAATSNYYAPGKLTFHVAGRTKLLPTLTLSGTEAPYTATFAVAEGHGLVDGDKVAAMTTPSSLLTSGDDLFGNWTAVVVSAAEFRLHNPETETDVTVGQAFKTDFDTGNLNVEVYPKDLDKPRMTVHNSEGVTVHDTLSVEGPVSAPNIHASIVDVAVAKIGSDGNVARGVGLSCEHVAGTGVYTMTLDAARPTSDYIVSVSPLMVPPGSTALVARVESTSVSPTSFTVVITEGNQGVGVPDIPADAPFFVTVSDVV